jgi:hypothetical protein
LHRSSRSSASRPWRRPESLVAAAAATRNQLVGTRAAIRGERIFLAISVY